MPSAERKTADVAARSLQRDFWERFAPELRPGQEVFVAQDMLPARVRDAQGRAVAGLAPSRPAALFFIDRMPPANRAHACTCIAIEPGGAGGLPARGEVL